MEKKIYFEKLEKFCGLEYLTLEKCPMYDDPEHGKVVDLKMKEMTTLAAVQIIKNMVPLRGIEISIVRTALNLSYENFAKLFNVSATTVFNWEKNKIEPVSIANDFLIRYYAAETFHCDIPKRFSKVSKPEMPESPIVFEIGA